VYIPTEEVDEVLADIRLGFATDLSDVLGIPVREIVVNDYNAVVEAMRARHADMAFLGPLTFAIANERANAIPIATLAPDGDKSQAFYYSVFIARADDDRINSLEDIKGKVMFFSDPNSTSASLVPTSEILQAFAQENLTTESLHTNGVFFEATAFTGSNLASLLSIKNGDADLTAMADLAINRMIGTGEINADDFKIFHQSPPIPSSVMAVRGDMPQALQDQIQAFLLAYDNEAYFERAMSNPGRRFVEASFEDYQPIIDLHHALNR